MSTAALVRNLQNRGFSLRVVDGSLRVKPTSAPTGDDREVIRAKLTDLIEALTPGEKWNQEEAQRLAAEAEALVNHLEVDGRHPAIGDAADMVRSALEMRDMETVRFACSEFMVVVRKVAARIDAPERPELD